MEILRLVRNSVHSNGRFTDRNGDTELTYGGESYHFRMGQQIKWDNRDMTLTIGWICEAMEDVLRCPVVASIPYLGVPSGGL